MECWKRVGLMLLFLSGAGGRDAAASILRVPDDYATIQAAVDAAVAGDVIRVGPGTYAEQVRIAKSAIQLEADPPGLAVLDGWTLAGTAAAISIVGTMDSLVTGVSIVGFTIENYLGAGIALTLTDRCQILANRVNNTGAQNIALTRTTFALVAGNVLSNGTFGVGMATRSMDNTVKENTIFGAFMHGIRVSMVQLTPQPASQNILKENLICVDDPERSVAAITIAGFATANVVKENRVVGDGRSGVGILLEGPTRHNVVKENLLNGHLIDIKDEGADNRVAENVHDGSLRCR